MTEIWSKYVAPVFLVTYGLQAIIAVGGGPEAPIFSVLAPIAMFVPGVYALIFLKRSGIPLRSIGWRLGRLRYLIGAALYPSITALICIGLITWMGLGLSPHLEVSGFDVVVKRGSFVLGRGQQHLVWFAANLFVTSVVFGFVNGLATVGEEVGWRGFLQGHLIARYGAVQGVALLGIIWAQWHTPIILQGYNYPETPVLGALVLWPLFCVCLSFVFAWFTIRARSVWPAVLGHGGVNAFHGSVVDGMNFTGARLGADLIVLLVLACFAIPAAVALSIEEKRRRTDTPDHPHGSSIKSRAPNK